ncbi:hypothetical protein CEQ90_16475 [Lewinellaceae bacterium SD302]|nr:hypothetical protein CEQ90_16475 [Lewinellaceae bacterium SD302]
MKRQFHQELKQDNALGILNQLAAYFNTEPKEDCNRYEFDLPEHFGNGCAVALDSTYGLEALIIQATPREEWTLRFAGRKIDPISFYSMAFGDMTASSEQFSFRVKPLQSAIHGGFGPTDYQWAFKAGEELLLMVVFIHKDVFFEQMDCGQLSIPDDLLSVVKNMNKVDTNFLFDDIYHLPIINNVKDIMEQSSVGLLNSTFSAGKIYENIYLALNAYKNYEEQENVRLVKREEQLRIIRNAESILVSRLQEPPTIPELARMVGINQQTLKQGFRQLYGETINQYLNEKRLEQAGILMRGGELSLKEVALAVGYSNASYFSRKFKEKYSVVPRKFNSGNKAPEE